MNIGELAKASGISAKMIRYYESIGLIPAAERSEAGYRIYQQQDIHTLKFIRRARHLGFGMEDIQKLLGLWQDQQRPSAEVKALALKHLQELESRIAEMQSMAQTLKTLAKSCKGNQRPDCPILDELASQQ